MALGLVAIAALGSACARAQPLYRSRWLDITACQSPSDIGRHGLAQTGETPDLRRATSVGRDAQATPCARSWRRPAAAVSAHGRSSAPRRRRPAANRRGPGAQVVKERPYVSTSSLEPAINPNRTLRPSSPIPQASSTGSRRWPGLWQAIGQICDLFSPEECQNYSTAAGCGFI
jgi:hypothetical protein